MAKRKIELKLELEELKNQEKKFDFIKSFSCSTEEEFKRFYSDNKCSFEQLKKIKDRIIEIESALMTKSEKLKKEAYLKELKKKFSGE